MNRRTDGLRPRWLAGWLVSMLVVAPGALSAQTSDESPFDDFPRLEGPDAETDELLDSSDPPEPQTETGDASFPDEPVELRLDPEQPLAYEVASRLDVSYENRPDFSPTYRSGLIVEYRPISASRRRAMPATPLAPEEDSELADGHPVMAEITDFSGFFQAPAGLRQPTRTHSLLRDGRFSFRLDDRGEASDVRLHPPTHPLVRSSIESMLRWRAAIRPTLPDDPVEPGDGWTDSGDVETGGDGIERNYQFDVEYTFAGWTTCGSTHCAVIDAVTEIEVDGLRDVVHLRTDAEATGSTRFRLLFSPESGRTVAARWITEADREATSRRPETDESVHRVESRLEVRTRMRLLEP